MRNVAIGMCAAFGAVVLLVMAAQTANANSYYDSSALNGNLQNQCTGFSAAIVAGTSLTVSAQCNHKATGVGQGVSVKSTSMDLSGEVVWNTETEAFTWDATRDDNNDITAKCTAVRGFDYSASDVTLELTCTVESSSGSTDADLRLNGKLTVDAGGNLERR